MQNYIKLTIHVNRWIKNKFWHVWV